MPLPTSLDDVSVQLIYSERPDKGNEDLWKFYAIALSPFVLGVPARQVNLFLHEPFLNLNDSTIGTVRKIVETTVNQTIPWLPEGYQAYFAAVVERAKSIDCIVGAPVCTLRFISGHGFHSHQQGGFLVCGKKVAFGELGPNATSLTVLDISNSHYAVACFDGTFPTGNPKKFKRKKYFATSKIGIPVVCDANDSTWPFRIGFHNQDENDDDESSFAFMSIPIGDSAACCLLAAVKLFLLDGEQEKGSLREIFFTKYNSLKSSFLGPDVDTPRAYANDLSGLEDLIRSRVLPVKIAAFECEMFMRQNKWYLTMERPLALLKGDDVMANHVVDYVINKVVRWHENRLQLLPDVDTLKEARKSQASWNEVLYTIGPFVPV
ncbi:expressed unknown protein [Seminavis robusta]|uniref:Uncharacterized protein n=1 Tax=Seminavis robusta TaxID=568900 RepID=A0A9N8HDR4_9STRA|nr:expressed unknown protein [Seminavis robusta]|eukprot:Sro439_g143110.1 n/a (378) ;mRNA; r:5165-6298